MEGRHLGCGESGRPVAKLPGLDHHHRQTSSGQQSRSGEAGDPGPDDDHIGFDVVVRVVSCRERAAPTATGSFPPELSLAIADPGIGRALHTAPSDVQTVAEGPCGGSERGGQARQVPGADMRAAIRSKGVKAGDLPQRQGVVIGAESRQLVVGSRRAGWRTSADRQGPPPNPGARRPCLQFIFPATTKRMAMLTIDSQRQYEAMGVNVTCGGIEVARTPERMEELRRRMSSAKNWDMQARLVSPAEIKELVPFINEEILLGGCYYPTVSAVDSLRAGTIFREKAQGMGALQTFANTEILGLETEKEDQNGRHRPGPDRRRICCDRLRGLEDPRIAKMAGATIPLLPPSTR